MINCNKASEFVEKKLNKELSLWQKFLLWQHLLICKLCKSYSVKSKIIENFIKQNYKKNKASKSLKDNIIKEINKNL